MKKARDVLGMVVNAKSLLNPLADERSGPDARTKSSSLGTGLHDPHDLGALLVGQPRGAPESRPRPQSFAALFVVPAHPLRHGRAVGIQLGRHGDRRAPLDVTEHGFGTPPERQILERHAFTQQLPNLVHFVGRQPRGTNRLSVACSAHGREQSTVTAEWKAEMTTALREDV